MRKTIIAAGIWLALAWSAVASADVSWTKVGHPTQARKIAACSDGQLYALNENRSLWVSTRGGADGSWARVRNLPTDTLSITCAGSTVYFQKKDRSLWSLRSDGEPIRIGRPGAAAEIAGAPDSKSEVSLLWALNDDKTLWRNPKGGVDDGWLRVGRPKSAEKIAAGNGEVYALNRDKTLWQNRAGGADDSWRHVDTPRAAIEITAAAPGRIYALNNDYSLWAGTVETVITGQDMKVVTELPPIIEGSEQEPIDPATSKETGPLGGSSETLAEEMERRLELPTGYRELNVLANRLDRLGTVPYTSYVFDWKEGQGARTIQPVKGGRFTGLLTMRDRQQMTELAADTFFDDGRGNLVMLAELVGGGGQPVPYSLTLTPAETRVIGVDLDADGAVEAALGETMGGRFWFLADLDTQWILKCLGMSKDLDAGSALLACAGAGGAGGSTGPGSGSGGFSDASGWSLKEPRCDSEAAFGLASSGHSFRDHLKNIRALREAARSHRDFGASARGEGRSGLGKAHEMVAWAADQMADRYEDYLDAGNSYGPDAPETEEAWEALEEAERNLLETYRQLREVDPSSGPTPGGQPVRGEPGAPMPFEDPRCGNTTNNPWTSGWVRRRDCGNQDPISCLLRFGDTILGETDGYCWQEDGPTGARLVECKENVTMKDCLAEKRPVEECWSREQEAEGRTGGSGSGPTDAPVRRPPGRGDSGVRWVDTVGLGGLIFTICQEAGGTGFCGDLPERLE